MRTPPFFSVPLAQKITHLVAGMMLVGLPISAQTGNVGINTTSPQAMLHVADSSVLFSYTGAVPASYPPPVSGTGKRMMWYPAKASFRVGGVDSDQWDQVNIGNYSFASGQNTQASGSFSTAIGKNCDAMGISSISIGEENMADGFGSVSLGAYNSAMGYGSTSIGFGCLAYIDNALAIGYSSYGYGFGSTAIGNENYANADYSLALGYGNSADGTYSSALGVGSIASGEYSSTYGWGLTAASYSSLVIGSYNDVSLGYTPDSWIDTEPIFIIGNGPDYLTPQTAMTVLKNGNVGIGELEPDQTLVVNGTTRLGTNGTVIEEIIKTTITLDVADIPALGELPQNYTVTGAQPGSTVYVSPESLLPSGVLIAYSLVTAADTVQVIFCNISGANKDPGMMDYHITVIR